MSAATADPDPLDLREQLVRIDHAIAETRKFQAEVDWIGRDRVLAPSAVIFAGLAAPGSTLGPALVRALPPGGHP